MVMSVKKSPEYAVFNIEGGIGKHVSSTAVVKAYKNNHPTTKIVVVCAWPEVYLNNKDVHRVYRLGNVPYFYQDYILDKDTKVFAQEPYKETAHITKKQHLIHTWCDMLDIKYSGETPYMNFNMREKAWIDPELAKIQKVKPILMFQPFGGPGKNHQGEEEDKGQYMPLGNLDKDCETNNLSFDTSSSTTFSISISPDMSFDTPTLSIIISDTRYDFTSDSII